MNGYFPKVGDRVRVTQVWEGVISSFGGWTPDAFALVCDDGTVRAGHFNAERTWERLPDPEPEWQSADVVIDADRNIWKYDPWPEEFPKDPWRAFNGHRYAADVPTRPLTLIASGGKPVAS